MKGAIGIAILIVGVAIVLLESQSSGSASADAGSGAGGGSAPAGPTNSQIVALASAIAAAEGYGVDGAIPTLANNPGDLALGDIGYGVMGSQNITIYGSLADGWNALYNELNLIFSGQSKYYNSAMTFAQMGETWAGPSGGPNWSANVASALGVSTTTTLAQWMGQ